MKKIDVSDVDSIYIDESKPKKKSDFAHQKSNVKMSVQQKDYIDAIRRVNHLDYNYEAVQLMIDNYMKNCNESQNKLIKILIEEL